MKRRVCLISETLWEPFDEGMKTFALYLARYLSARYDFLGLTNQGAGIPKLKVRSIGFSKTMGSRELARVLRTFSPEVLIYLPRASVTCNSFLRAWRLKRLLPSMLVVLIGLQSRRHSAFARWLIRRLRTDRLLVQGQAAMTYFEKLGFSPRRIPSGVDVDKYRPVAPSQKAGLRRKYGVPQNTFLLSHVGHLRASRNTDLLKQAGRLPNTHVLMIASSHGKPDPALKADLQQAGVEVHADYVENLEEIYQMSDAYLFPVLDDQGAIGMPLTVFEALACDTPVISSPFGDLQQELRGSAAVHFIHSFADLEQARSALANGIKPGSARALALPYAWDKLFDEYIQDILSR